MKKSISHGKSPDYRVKMFVYQMKMSADCMKIQVYQLKNSDYQLKKSVYRVKKSDYRPEISIFQAKGMDFIQSYSSNVLIFSTGRPRTARGPRSTIGR